MPNSATSFLLAVIIGVVGVLYVFWPIILAFLRERLSDEKDQTHSD